MRRVKLNKVIHRYASEDYQYEGAYAIKSYFPECIFFPFVSSDMDNEECVVSATHGTIVFIRHGFELNIFYNGNDYVWFNYEDNMSWCGTIDELVNFINEKSG